MSKDHELFKDPVVLANHIIHHYDRESHIQINSILYLLFAYYGASYGKDLRYPKYLFNESFEAWQFGPRLASITKAFHEDELEAIEWIPKTPMEIEIFVLLNDVLEMYDELDDFQLVDIMHDEKVWKDTYIERSDHQQHNEIIDSEKLIEKYIQYIE